MDNMRKLIERILDLYFKEDLLYSEIEDISLVTERVYGNKKVQNNSYEEKLLSKLKLRYCRITEPRCPECVINHLCSFGRKKLFEVAIKGIPFIDLFCGAGGLSLGLERNGFIPIFAIDYNEPACKTYMLNRPYLSENHCLNEDIGIVIEQGLIPSSPIVVGGPPCQSFSNANRQRLTDDPRNYLYKYFIEGLKRSGANICLFENVPGILTASKAVERDFDNIGFKIKSYVLNAKDFGYPQNRNRIFWLGVKTKNDNLFMQINSLFESLFRERFISTDFVLIDAINDLPPLEAKTIKNNTNIENDKWGHTISGLRNFETNYCKLINNGMIRSFLYNHKSKYNNDRDIEIYQRLKPGERSDSNSIEDINPYKNRGHIFKDKFFKLEPDKPSKTITAHMYYDCHMYIHPFQARGLTPREAARIQGFPDNYLFLGSPNEWYRQIGNAVSPLMARHIGHALKGIFEEYRKDLI